MSPEECFYKALKHHGPTKRVAITYERLTGLRAHPRLMRFIHESMGGLVP